MKSAACTVLMGISKIYRWMHILSRASGFPVFVKHGDATCAQRMKCCANGPKHGLSILRCCKSLRPLRRCPTAMSLLPRVANSVWLTRGSLASFSTVAHRHVHRRCCPNPAACAYCCGYTIPLLMTSLWPWLVLVTVTSKMLSPRTV